MVRSRAQDEPSTIPAGCNHGRCWSPITSTPPKYRNPRHRRAANSWPGHSRPDRITLPQAAPVYFVLARRRQGQPVPRSISPTSPDVRRGCRPLRYLGDAYFVTAGFFLAFFRPFANLTARPTGLGEPGSASLLCLDRVSMCRILSGKLAGRRAMSGPRGPYFTCARAAHTCAPQVVSLGSPQERMGNIQVSRQDGRVVRPPYYVIFGG